VQFEPKRSAEQLEILAFVDAARRQDPRPRWPLPQPNSAGASALSDPMLGYLLAAIDGTRGPEELSELLALELDLTDRMLRELASLGALKLVPAGAALPPSHKPRLARRLTQSIRPNPTGEPPRGAARAIEPALLIELRALWSKLPELDHYRVLGLTRGAGREQIRKAFYELSRRFHPDSYYGAALGDDLPKLERVFGRLSEAYAVLSREGSQTEYHRYLDHKLTLERMGAAKAPDHAATERAPSEPRLPELTLRSPKPPSSEPSAARRLWEALQDRRVLERGLSELRAQAMYEEKHQRWDDAAVSWQRLCEAAPDDAAAHQAAALALHHTGADPSRTIELARRAVELAPTDAAARRTLGNAYLAGGLKHRARDEFEAAQRLQGETPTLPPSETATEGGSA
jgi:tetratricopeptide (TPR) repeat protein